MIDIESVKINIDMVEDINLAINRSLDDWILDLSRSDRLLNFLYLFEETIEETFQSQKDIYKFIKHLKDSYGPNLLSFSVDLENLKLVCTIKINDINSPAAQRVLLQELERRKKQLDETLRLQGDLQKAVVYAWDILCKGYPPKLVTFQRS